MQLKYVTNPKIPPGTSASCYGCTAAAVADCGRARQLSWLHQAHPGASEASSLHCCESHGELHEEDGVGQEVRKQEPS